MYRYREKEVAQEVTEVSVLAEKRVMPTRMHLPDCEVLGKAQQTFAAYFSKQVGQDTATGWREASVPVC